MIGRIVSTKMKKTAVVLIERTAVHPLYKKTFKRSKKYLVDDLLGVKDGDLVEIVKSSPVSKRKHWKIIKVVGKDLKEIVEAKQKEAAEEIIAEVMPEEKAMDENTKLKSEERSNLKNSEKKVVVDDSKFKPKSKKGGRTESSK